MAGTTKWRWAVGAVLLLALTVRLSYFATLARGDDFRTPSLDGRWFHAQALAIEEGNWHERESTFRAPGYPLFLAAVYAALSADPAAARLVQLLLGVLTVYLVIRLTSRLFDADAAVVSGVLASLYWVTLYFEGELLIASILPLAAALLFNTLLTARERKDDTSALLAGLSAALFVLLRPNVILFLPLAVAGLARRRMRSTILFTAVIAVSLVPVTLRNRITSGEWIFLASQGGLNFYIGNHPSADGMHAVFPGLSSWNNDDIRRLTAGRVGHVPGEGELSRYWAGEAARSIASDPAHFARLLLKKSIYLLGGYEIGNNRDLYRFRDGNGVLSLPLPGWAVVLSLAAAGFLSRRRRWGEEKVLVLYLAAYAVSILLFFVCARFRVPLVPALLPFAGAGLTMTARAVRRGGASLAVPLLLLAGTALLSADPLGSRDSTEGQDSFQRANLLARLGRPKEAIAAYEKAIEKMPAFPGAHYHLGVVLIGEGRREEGRKELVEAIRLDRRNAKVRNVLALDLASTGETAEAKRTYRDAIAADPYFPDTYINFGGLLAMEGKRAEAEELFRNGGELLPGDPVPLLNLGKLLFSEGRVDEAIPLLRDAARLGVDRVDCNVELGSALFSIGDFDGAVSSFRRAATLDPNDTSCLMNLALALVRKGDRQGAAEMLRRVVRIEPANEAARDRLAALGY